MIHKVIDASYDEVIDAFYDSDKNLYNKVMDISYDNVIRQLKRWTPFMIHKMVETITTDKVIAAFHR